MPKVNDLAQVTLLVTLLEEITHECEFVPQTQEQHPDRILILRLIADIRVERKVFYASAQSTQILILSMGNVPTSTANPKSHFVVMATRIYLKLNSVVFQCLCSYLVNAM